MMDMQERLSLPIIGTGRRGWCRLYIIYVLKICPKNQTSIDPGTARCLRARQGANVASEPGMNRIEEGRTLLEAPPAVSGI